ncbi:hypothetical protein [Sphingomonas sp.]|uniref:hypothetical protein n=1 Tax=Sphingomonas sp. TaxID=28214 RepID=UPI002DD63F81|nr:hypothetical protein [Sphingomonas sp.]
MDALIPAFVAALAAGIGDRPARLAARLGDSAGAGRTVSGMAIGHATGIAISVAGAMWMAPMLTPNARALMLAVALVFAGAGALWGSRAPAPPRGSPVIAAAAGSFVAGDRTAFLAFGLALNAAVPLLAGAGALAGALVLAGVAATLGNREWERLPLTLVGRIAGGVMLPIGLIVGAGALRLT